MLELSVTAGSLPRVLLAVAVVALVAWVGGTVAARLGQPPVIGEILAAISLGPSVVGALVPAIPDLLFPAAAADSLELVAEAGVVLFMFFVGVDFEGDVLRERSRLTLAVVAGSVTLPLALGVAVALPFVDHLGTTPARAWLCALFVGVALSVTAFPVLAAIVQEARLTTPALGHLALGCAAFIDVIAWSMLAVVSAEAKATAVSHAAEIMLLALAFAAIVLGPLRLLVRAGFSALPERARRLVVPLAGIALAGIFAALTGRLGVTVVFGAFLAGLAVGGRASRRYFDLPRVRRFNRVVLLPVFFALVGLAIDLDPASGALALAGVGLVLLTAAVVGKIGGTVLAARLAGLRWREAFGLGVLLDTKGLTEIVVLRIGYDLRLLSAGGLAVLVAVALLTTAATTPLLRALGLAHGPVRGRMRAGHELPDAEHGRRRAWRRLTARHG